jgi:hypothetical protein
MNAIRSTNAVGFVYCLRVVLISFEALVLAGAWLSWTHFLGELQAFTVSVALNDEVLKYLMLLPVAVAIWVINESRTLLQEDKETVRILTRWPDYWKLKMHVWVGLTYAIVFAVMSVLPWVAKSGISTGIGMLLFLTSIVGQLFVAASVYAARVRAKEILAHAKSP